MSDIRALSFGAFLAALILSAAPLAAQEQTWNRTLERIATGVVSIQIDSTRSFDTERNQSSQATGFVVDAERGLILTNRHVVTPGPVRAQAVFLNRCGTGISPRRTRMFVRVTTMTSMSAGGLALRTGGSNLPNV